MGQGEPVPGQDDVILIHQYRAHYIEGFDALGKLG